MRTRTQQILDILKKYYLKTGPFTNWSTPLELVVATMLSAQCTDKQVNKVTPKLFSQYKSAVDYGNAHIHDLEDIIYSTGFYKSKARHLKAMGNLLKTEYAGCIPRAFEDLIRIPGISKKSACIIGAKAFGRYYGVPVDTHVLRIAVRLGLNEGGGRDAIALSLEKSLDPREYLEVNEYLITLGRDVCLPRKPRCSQCPLRDTCPKKGVILSV